MITNKSVMLNDFEKQARLLTYVSTNKISLIFVISSRFIISIGLEEWRRFMYGINAIIIDYNLSWEISETITKDKIIKLRKFTVTKGIL